MRSLVRVLGRAILLLVVLGAAFWVLGPREGVERGAVEMPDLSDPAGWLAAREAALEDLTPGNEARIVWAGPEGMPSDLVILYLHGFSAGPQETRPMPDLVAEGLGANLILARLPGHGRTGEALAEARVGDWVDEAASMLHLARGIGDSVVIMGVSTGGTLATYLMAEPDMAEDVAALVLLSPNYEVVNPLGVLLEWPMARIWTPWIAGAERSFEAYNERHGTFWTQTYPTSATVTMGTLLRETRERDYSGIDTPALFLFSDSDQVVSAPATRAFAERWEGPTTLIAVAVPEEGGDPDSHVIAGDILSPALTDRVASDITDWLRDTLQ